MTSFRPSSPPSSPSESPEFSSRAGLLRALEEALGQQDWRQADRLTTDLLLTQEASQGKRHLTVEAIAHLPCDLLHSIDQAWMHHSSGQFGFSAQRAIYTEAAQRHAFTFSQQVNWTVLRWRPLGFYKFYNGLSFDLAAAPGHLPAHWFWQLPWYQSLWRGGLGTGRGAAFGDAGLVDALMLRLERCQQV